MKKLIAWVLTLTLLLSLAPSVAMGVTAEEITPPAAHSHSAAQHDCEHCEDTVTWTAWEKNDSLPTGSGHYYLTADVKISAQTKLTGTADQVICLNGYTIDGNSKNVWYLQDTAKLTVSDCTAYTDAEGVLHAATVKNCKQSGAMAAAIYAKNGASLAVYNIIFADNSLTKNTNSVEGRGGTIQLRGDVADKTVTLHVENCWFEGNNIGQSAGAVNVITTKDTAVAKATLKGCTFKENNALQGGAIYALNADMTIEECTFQGNTAETGAAIFAKTCKSMTVTKCTFKENVASKGAVFHVNKCDVTVDQCTFDSNTGKTSGGSVFHIHGTGGHLILKDSTLKNNVSTSKGDTYRGTVYLTNKADNLTLRGKVVFEDNIRYNKAGEELPAAIYVQDNPNPIDVGGLTAGAKVFVETMKYEAADLNEIFVAATAPAEWDHTVLTYMDKQVDYSTEKGFHFYEAPVTPPEPDHAHCQCGEAACTAHELIAYSKWEDATALPTEGKYYLAVDVNMAAEATVTGDLQLCLNGHTVTAANNKRHLSTPKDSGFTVVISDCTAAYDAEGNYTAGKFTGGKDVSGNAGGGSLYMRSGTTLKFFDGIVCNNSTVYGGAGIFIMNDSVLEMYDGLLTDNIAKSADGKTWKVGGNIRSNAGHVKICGGTIQKGSGVNGGGIYGTGGTITVTGGTICGNYSSRDGAGIYMKTGVLTVNGNVTICHNHTDGSGSAVCFGSDSTGAVTGAILENNTGAGGGGAMVQNGAVATFTNVTVRNNEATGNGGGIYLYKAELTLKDCTITGNTAKTGGGINATNSAALTVENGTIKENEATGQTGGVRVSETSSLTLKGTPDISGNENLNLVLLGGTLMDVTGMTGGNIQITADMGPISTPCSDLAQYFSSESVYRGVVYRDGALYMATDGSHKHCFCKGADSGCSHELVEWTAWEATDSLPASGSYYLLSDIVLTDEQSITSDVNICLNGYSVKAADGKRHISTVKGTDVTITICDCTAKTEDGVYTAGKLFGGIDTSGNSGGGAIYIRSESTLRFFDGILTENTSTTMGGAIFLNSGATLQMYNGLICNNTAVSADGLTQMDGGGIAAYIANVEIHGGTVTGNTAGDGGGVYMTTRCTFTMTGGTISGNTATTYGGGVYTKTGKVNITGGEIRENTAGSSAGGLYLATESSGTMTGGTIAGNTAKQGAGVILSGASALEFNAAVSDNVATSGSGGGFALYSKSVLTVTGGTVKNNTAKANGGGIYNNASTVNITGGAVTGNYGAKDGGGAYVKSGAIHVSGETMFTSNTTDVNGGGISYGTDSTGTVSGGTFRSNKADGGGALMVQNGANIKIEGGSFVSNTGTSARGGAVRIYKATVTVTGGTFEKNKAVKSAGGAFGAATDCKLIITGGTIKNNTAKSNGGAIATSTRADVELSNVTITGNTGDKDGGGIYVYKSRLDIKGNVTMSGNTTKVNGGAVSYGTGSSGYVSGLTAYGNNAGSGGGLMIQGGAKVTIGYASITGHTTKKYAGGIYLYKASLNMTGGYIANNKAPSVGGVIYAVDAVELKMSNVKMVKNEAKNGGAIYLKNTVGTFKDLEITENTATNLGGAVYLTGGANWGKLYPSEMTNVKIIGNTAAGETGKGGGIYMNVDLPLTCVGCEISDNYTTMYGGGVYALNGAKITMSDCLVSGNEAGEHGGGVMAWDFCELTNTTFSGNKALRGAGVFAGNPYERYSVNGFGSKGDDVGMTVTGCTFVDNDATVDGGGLHLDMSCYTTIHDTTFTGNTAGQKGSAMWLWENCTMTDVTVTGNVSPDGGYAVYLADSEYDGQTYINGLFKMGGDMIIKDNEGGDLFLDNYVTIGALKDGYGPKTHMNITLDANLLTQRVMGAYNYEGGNLVYTLTYGDRSVTDPEYDPDMVAQAKAGEPAGEKASAQDILLYVGIGAIGLAAVAAAALVLLKKKKAAKPEETK